MEETAVEWFGLDAHAPGPLLPSGRCPQERGYPSSASQESRSQQALGQQGQHCWISVS